MVKRNLILHLLEKIKQGLITYKFVVYEIMYTLLRKFVCNRNQAFIKLMNFNQNLCTIRKFNVKNTFHVSQRSTQIPVLI